MNNSTGRGEERSGKMRVDSLSAAWYVLAIGLCVLTAVSHSSAQTKRAKQPAHQVRSPKRLKRDPFDPKRDPKADLADAVARATDQHKRIILDIGGEWCGWCRYMDEFFAAHAGLSRARDKNYVWLKINYSEENENRDFPSTYPSIEGYPHLFVLDSDGKLLQSQDTSVFERGEVYSANAILKFLKEWSATSREGP